ncbi:protein of unknown function [Acidithiobacillus ferrivorans]|uniref:Uncharacterized protein n=1 Tax=Acidithiobacillus ferrivorans TaxID=160808 RepID=A0ABY1ML54_9PROT|nr:protein of unknown function [Acidithiobacillus ferrivorans]
MIAAHDAGCLDAGHGNGEPDAVGEVAAVRDRANHWQLGRLVELGRRHDKHGTAAVLLAPFGRIK